MAIIESTSSKWPEGLRYIPNFITPEEERVLVQNIEALNWEEVALFGQVAKRRVVHFGLNYHYGNRKVSPTLPPPDFLKQVINKSAQLLGHPPAAIAEVLITEYPLQAGINWHRDAPVFKDIIGLSLYSNTTIYFRKIGDKKQQVKLQLEKGSAYVLTNAIRWDWEHRIAPVKTQRYSITLRTLSNVSL